MTVHRSMVALLVAAALGSASVVARAQVTKDQCIDANAQAQSYRRTAQFTRARTLLRTCLDPACPEIIRTDCGAQLEGLDRAQPTMLFDAHDPAGNDLAAVRVLVDGQVLAERLDGTALAVDPGPHEFVFQAEGQPPVQLNRVVIEGEKARRETVVIGLPKPPPQPPVSPSPVLIGSVALRNAIPPSPPGQAQRTVGLVIGGAGLAAVAVGGVFGVLAGSARDAYQQHCGGNIGATAPGQCDAQGVSGHDDAVTKATLSTAFFIGGGVLAATGVTVFFTAPHQVTTVVLGFEPQGVTVRGVF